MARTKLIGVDYSPPDLVAKMTGRARYAEDFREEGMLFAKLLLSPMPHARVRHVDYDEALAMPGVEAVLTADEVPGVGGLNETCLTNEPLFEGQPILAVAAVDETTGADAIEKIKIDLEPLPFVLDPLESLRPGGPNARLDGNVLKRERTDEGPRTSVATLKWTAEDFATLDQQGQLPMAESEDEWTLGDIDAAFSEAAFVQDETLFHQSLTHHPMEPRSCMAYWRNGKLFIHPSTQSVARTTGVVARAVGIDPSDVVLICEYTGGGFGSKIVGSVNMAIPALLAKKTGRPVLHRCTRYEENYIGRARAGFQARARMAWREDGRLLGLDLFIVQDNGPYGRQGDARTASGVASLSLQPLSMRFRSVSIFTNTPPRSAQRAPGGMQITAMLEPLVDRAARKLGVDRLEMRRINAPSNGSPFGGPSQQNVTTAYVREAADKLAELVNWEEKKKLSGQRQGTKVTGVGVALSSFVAGTAGYDGLMVIKPDGKLYVHTGVGNLGTHSYSDTARVAAEVLDIPWEKCEVIWGDTGKHLPWSAIQAGSMTTHSTTRAIHAGAVDARQKLQEIAARDLGGSPSQYEVAAERVYRKGNRSQGMSLARAAERAIALGGKWSGQELAEELHGMTKAAATALAGQGLMGVAKDKYPQGGAVYSFVLGFARVEIDVETGHLVLKEYSAVTDCGTVLNPRSLVAQLHGGGVQGFGAARSQRWVYDPQWGVPFANRFYTARPPTILDVPLEMKADYVNLPDPNTPVGAKGIGEPPIGAGSAALICAIQDAVGEGFFNRTPIMTDMILTLLEGGTPSHEPLAIYV